MELLLPAVVLGVSLGLEVFIYSLLPKEVKLAGYFAAFTIMLVMFAGFSYALLQLCLCSVLLLGVSLFRVVNLSRVAMARMHPKALARRYGRSALWLGVLSLLVVTAVHFEVAWNELEVLLWLSVAGSLILFAVTLLSLRRWRSSPPNTSPLQSVPTVSVCIPARNETQDLPACIEALLVSSYPKLEILVLDDCSHDKTPAVIKEYAHKGVRFMKGAELAEGWLAKNQAMNKLFDESTGDVVIFAGVDVRFSKDTVMRLVEQLENAVSMVSILPTRSPGHEGSVFIQPLRYWWELAVPKLLSSRPPTLSTVWAIRRETLKELGEFDSLKNSVQPESHFAKKLGSAYKFVISGNRLGVTSAKAPRDQFDTALRVRYPQLKRRPEFVVLVLLLELLVYVTPLVGLVVGLVDSDGPLIALSIVSIVLQISVNLIISALAVPKTWFVGLITVPLLMVEEWLLLIRSMLAYEFGVVTWKDRNICLPMLKVEKNLPKL